MRAPKEYLCPQCSRRVTITPDDVMRDGDNPAPACPSCGCEMDWAPSAMQFSLKGGGWPSKSFKR